MKRRKGERPTYWSAYQLMWILVMFDLPTQEKEEKREYVRFRNFLLDQGFSMTQFSVYYRPVSGKEEKERLERIISKQLPARGKVEILSITDKQYGDIKYYSGKKPQKNQPGDQLLLL